MLRLVVYCELLCGNLVRLSASCCTSYQCAANTLASRNLNAALPYPARVRTQVGALSNVIRFLQMKVHKSTKILHGVVQPEAMLAELQVVRVYPIFLLRLSSSKTGR